MPKISLHPSRARHEQAPKLAAVDLFSGCGGMSLGLRQAGFEVIAAVELDKLSVEMYSLNHPKTLVFLDDIRNIDPIEFHKRINSRQVDLLAACPPCQGFSRVRTRNGSTAEPDARNSLLFEILKFVDFLNPRAVMLENVPGLATNWRFSKFTTALRKRGFHLNWKIEDAAAQGVPQRRLRLIMVALKGTKPTFAAPVLYRRTVRDAIGDIPPPGQTGDRAHDIVENRSSRIRGLIARVPKNGGSRSDLSEQLACHIETDGFYDVYGRMTWDEVAPTITGGCVSPSKGRYLHPTQDRAITLREAALLQSFPRSYRFPRDAGKYRLATLIGNALPPTFVRRQALQIRKALTTTIRDPLAEHRPLSSPSDVAIRAKPTELPPIRTNIP